MLIYSTMFMEKEGGSSAAQSTGHTCYSYLVIDLKKRQQLQACF